MLFISVEDFYEKAALCTKLTRQEEMECAINMKNGDMAARERLIQSYIPMTAGIIKHKPANMQTLGLALYCMQALEKAVDSFDFIQAREPFSHHLSRWLRQAMTGYIANRNTDN